MRQIARVWVTQIVWELGDREVHIIRSRDCFAHVERLGLDLTAGDFIEVKLKVLPIRRSTRPVTVTLRAPSRMSVTDPSQETLIDRYLETIGLRRGGESTERPELWDLAHAPQAMHTWRRVFGSVTDRLVRERVLVQTVLGAVPHPDAATGDLLAVEELENGEFFGVSLRDDLPSRGLTPTDVDGAALDLESYADFLRRELQIAAPPVVRPDPALMHLGLMDIDGLRFQVFYAMTPARPSLLTLAALQSNGDSVLVLLPPGRELELNHTTTLSLPTPVPERGWLDRAALEATGQHDMVPALRMAPPEAKLVIDQVRGKVWVYGVEIPGLKPGTHPFRLVLALANACPRAVPTVDLADELCRGRADPTATARKARPPPRRQSSRPWRGQARSSKTELPSPAMRRADTAATWCPLSGERRSGSHGPWITWP